MFNDLVLKPMPELITKNKLRSLYSASELYRLPDRHLLAKFSANFCG
jgi:hypothetical protein